MDNKPRVILASLFAPIAVLLVPALLAIITAWSPAVVRINANDDAPIRAAGIMLYILIPLSYPILIIAMAVMSYILLALQKLSQKNLFIMSGIASVAIGIFFGLRSQFGVEDQLITFVIFASVSMLCMALGVFSWWSIAFTGHSESIKPTAGTERP